MSESLADILGDAEPRPGNQPEAQQQPAGDQPTTETVEAGQEGEQPEVQEESEQETVENGAPPAPGTKQVPLAALEATRRERADFKSQSVELKTRLEERDRELAEMRRQLEEARRPQPAPAQQQPAQPMPNMRLPNPVEDPEGYANAVRANIEQSAYDARLNWSEANLRQRHQDVDEKVAWFKEAVAQNPRLAAELRRHPDPYVFAYEQGQRFNLTREISSDPAAYRARIEAEIRASLEQPAQPEAAPKPAPSLPSSLASARSAGERSAPAWTGPPPLGDVLKG